jgi:hypothetical protein
MNLAEGATGVSVAFANRRSATAAAGVEGCCPGGAWDGGGPVVTNGAVAASVTGAADIAVVGVGGSAVGAGVLVAVAVRVAVATAAMEAAGVAVRVGVAAAKSTLVGVAVGGSGWPGGGPSSERSSTQTGLLPGLKSIHRA